MPTTNSEQETLNAMALTRMDRFHPAGVRELYKRLGSATEVMAHRTNIQEVIPDASRYLIEGLANADIALARAEEEMEYDRKHNIATIDISDARYPQRLRECADAPLVLYYLGTADLNARHTINIVGTRRCTNYGRDLIKALRQRPPRPLSGGSHLQRTGLWHRHLCAYGGS